MTIDEVAYRFGLPAQRLDFLIRMQGEFPSRHSLDRLARELEKDPSLLSNPLAAYKHVYHNGNPGAAPAAKKLIFLHMQHTGGETVTRIMQANLRSIGMRRDLAGLPTLPPHFLLSCYRALPADERSAERKKWSRYDALAEHGIYGMHEMLDGPYGYFTLLRHPLNRLIDYCRVLNDERASNGNDPRPIGDYLRDESFRRDILLGKSYVQKFSGYPLVGSFLLRLTARSVVERAKRKLGGFDLVLIAERFEESMQVLCETYGWKDGFYEDGAVKPRNGRFFDPSMTDVNYTRDLTLEERSMAEEMLCEDLELYEWGLRLFAARLAKQEKPKLPREKPLSNPPTDLYRTRIGPLRISARWAKIAQDNGVEPAPIEIAFREAYYARQLEGPAFMDYAVTQMKLPRDIARMWLETNHAEHIATEVIEHDSYQLNQMRRDGFQPKSIVDIGGHIGTFTLLARHVWPAARIITIEPLSDDRIDPNNVNVLRLNTAAAKGITVINAALLGFFGGPADDNAARVEELLRDPNHEHWLELGLRGYPGYAKPIRRSQMKALSVAQLIAQTGIDSVDLLKIDCEGSETNVLREFAALGLLPQIDRIVGEWHGTVAKEAIPALLAATHEVDFRSVPPLHKSGIFRAKRRTLSFDAGHGL